MCSGYKTDYVFTLMFNGSLVRRSAVMILIVVMIITVMMKVKCIGSSSGKFSNSALNAPTTSRRGGGRRGG